MSSASPILDPRQVIDAYSQVRDDGNGTNWFCLNYVSNDIVMKGIGTDYADLLKNFTGDERCYAYYRMVAGDKMSVRAKFLFITWIGPSVSPLKKAKVSTDKAFVKEITPDFSLEILADDPEDLKFESLKARVELASGAKY